MPRLMTAAATAALLALMLGCPLITPPMQPPGDEKPEFSYSGTTGPTNWGSLAEDWSTCRDGVEQSPIDITGTTVDATLPTLETDYEPTHAVLLNNGHTWELEYEPGSTLTINDETYELLQFHFHTPSEHLIAGAAAAMEMHLVHRNADGNLAVIGVLFEVGAENAWLAEFWDDFPRSEGEVEEEYEVNVADGLPNDLSYFTYAGSLTTPPCSEIVTWVVLKTPLTASQAQIDAMNNTFGDNARPIQPLNGRSIRERS